MLEPDARSLMLDALRPPAGAELSRALALTFTLDLESLLLAPLAFARHGARDSGDPIAVMEGVRRRADRIDVFCQAGQIAVPQSYSQLLAFVEPMVHQVRRPRPGHLFHPKLWVLRFTDPVAGETSLRLLVLSRNLTNDRSWDVCLRLDGEVGTQPVAGNRPLFNLVQHTLSLVTAPLPAQRQAAVEQLAEDLRRARWELPEDVREMYFHALGVPGSQPPDFAGTRHLVVSPFCTPEGLRRCAPGDAGIVVSRQETLDGLEGLDRYTIRVVNSLAGLPADETSNDQEILHGLHAKVYVIEKGQQARLLVGSANATGAAFGGNVELLVELVGGRARYGIEALVGEAGFGEILEPYERQEQSGDEPADLRLRELVRDIAGIPLTAEVSGEEDRYMIRLISTDALPEAPDARLTAQLHTRRGEAIDLVPGKPVDATFDDLALTDVTPFVVVTAENSSGREQTVVLAMLSGDATHRLDRIIAQQVDTPDKFLRFLLLMLGLGTGGIATVTPEKGADGYSAWLGSSTGILELILDALADRPQQLDDLARLVERLVETGEGDRVLPAGFTQMWALVEEVRGMAGAVE